MKATMKKIVYGIGLCAVTAGCLVAAARIPARTQAGEITTASSLEQNDDSAVESAVEKLDAMEKSGEPLTDAEMDELVDGVLNPEEEPAQEENASASTSSVPASSADTAQSTEASTASNSGSHSTESSSAASDTAHSTASSSQAGKDSCDEQVAKLIAQLYAQQDRYERELLEIIRQAHQEYVAYPEEERSLVLKVQVVLSKTSALTELEKECDAEVETICSQMEAVLKANGRDTTPVKEARKTYNQTKSDLKQELVRQTYSGGDGSGSAGHWLYDQLGE